MNDQGVSDSMIRDINSPSLFYIFVNPSTKGIFIDRKTNSLLACESKLIAQFITAFYPVLQKCNIEEKSFVGICDLADNLCEGNFTIVDVNALDRHLAK